LGFFVDAGVKLSIPLKATASVSGNYATSGIYETGPSPRDSEEWSSYGFYTRKDINVTDDIEIKGVNMSFYTSAGVNIPLGYYKSVNIGPEIMVGLTDILRNLDNYTDIFGYSYKHQPTKAKYFGIRFSFAYKL
jgi:hypothetical protein